MFKVQFEGTLLEMKEWLALMPDNLAGVLHTKLEAATQPVTSSLEERALAEIHTWQKTGQKISAIKAVRTVAQEFQDSYVRGCQLRDLKGARDFVESVWNNP